MSVRTPAKVALPAMPTAAVRFASRTTGEFNLAHRVQAEGLDEFDLEAAAAAAAITGANGRRSRARRVFGELRAKAEANK